jgi:GntR family carbon starvation induced transcriptional regulator
MNDVADQSLDARKAAKTLVDFAYEQVRADILSAKLAPGSKLRVERLRLDYGVGAGTLREALSRLAADALVNAEGQRGFRVAPVSLEDLRDITDMRVMLETEALRRAIANGDDDWEAGIVAAYHRLTKVEEKMNRGGDGAIADWEPRNREFHQALIAACDSKWLMHFHRALYDQSERYRRMSMADTTIPRNIHAEHAAIKDATLQRDVEQAVALTEHHIIRTAEKIASLVQQGILDEVTAKADAAGA